MLLFYLILSLCSSYVAPLQDSLLINHKNIPLNAYVHIPFCRRRCHYCNFPIKVIGKNKLNEAADDYVSLLTREIVQTGVGNKATLDKILELGGLRTLYFGGGTPSMIEPSLLQQIITSITDMFGKLHDDCEVTMEMVS